MFEITVMWDKETREVGWYDLRQKCKECGAESTAPTPIDWKDE
jgi:rRNA maturation protein Nop10